MGEADHALSPAAPPAARGEASPGRSGFRGQAAEGGAAAGVPVGAPPGHDWPVALASGGCERRPTPTMLVVALSRGTYQGRPIDFSAKLDDLQQRAAEAKASAICSARSSGTSLPTHRPSLTPSPIPRPWASSGLSSISWPSASAAAHSTKRRGTPARLHRRRPEARRARALWFGAGGLDQSRASGFEDRHSAWTTASSADPSNSLLCHGDLVMLSDRII